MDHRITRETNDDLADAEDCAVSNVQGLAEDILDKIRKNLRDGSLWIED